MVKLLLLVLASSLLALQASAATQADLAVEALCNDKERRLNPPAPNCGVDSNMGGNYSMYPGCSPIVQFDVRACPSYWDIGYATGRRFSAMIRTRLYDHMHRQLLWFNSSKSGQDLIPRLAAHSARSDVLIAGPREGNVSDPARTRVPLLAHNEQETASREGALYMLIGKSGGATWVGYCYAGELCCIGNGWNSYGLAFTENCVEPAYRPFVGTGLVFLGRSLLEAKDVPDALQRLAQPDVMMRVNFNLLDRIGEGGGSIGSAEVGPFGAFTYHQVAAGEWQFHANMYHFMDITQYPSKISMARAEAATAFPGPAGMPVNVSDALSILGDTTTNPALPIFFEPTYNKEDITTGTVLFSPANRTMTVYTGNPRKGHVSFIFHLHSLNSSVPLEPYTGIGGNSRSPSMA